MNPLDVAKARSLNGSRLLLPEAAARRLQSTVTPAEMFPTMTILGDPAGLWLFQGKLAAYALQLLVGNAPPSIVAAEAAPDEFRDGCEPVCLFEPPSPFIRFDAIAA
jgi:hypothetical protein